VAARLDSILYLNMTMQVMEVIGQFSDFESEFGKVIISGRVWLQSLGREVVL
jgi:hypothetical protein